MQVAILLGLLLTVDARLAGGPARIRQDAVVSLTVRW